MIYIYIDFACGCLMFSMIVQASFRESSARTFFRRSLVKLTACSSTFNTTGSLHRDLHISACSLVIAGHHFSASPKYLQRTQTISTPYTELHSFRKAPSTGTLLTSTRSYSTTTLGNSITINMAASDRDTLPDT